MKKLLALTIIAGSTFTLATACGSNTTELPQAQDNNKEVASNFNLKLTDAAITDYLGKDNIKYIDIRNMADKSGGYVKGFEFVGFFEFLQSTTIDFTGTTTNHAPDSARMVYRSNGWSTATGDYTVNDNFAVTQYFGSDKNAPIFLMCASGTRAGFLEHVLENDFGYKNVFNVGGWGTMDNAVKNNWTVSIK